MEKFDSFGKEIQILLNGQSYNKTKFGSIITMSLCAILAFRFSTLIIDVKQGNNPAVLFQERQTDNIKRFDINPQTYNIALTFQDSVYNYVQADKVFEVEAYLETKINIKNKDNDEVTQKWDRIKFQFEHCTDDHLQIQEARHTFLSTNIHMSYCLPKNAQLHLEGEFNSDNFAQIIINFRKCKGPNCYDDTQMKEKIKTLYVGAQFSDVYFSPENKDQPFTFYGRNIFWENSKNFQKKIYMELRNNYVESDFGFFQSDIKTDIYPSFQRANEFIFDKVDDIESQLVIRFEKVKENIYKRSYPTGLKILSEIGGFLSFLKFVGFILTAFYTKIHLYEQLINNTFSFKEHNESQISSVKQDNIESQRIKNSTEPESRISKDIIQKDIEKGKNKKKSQADLGQFLSAEMIYSNQKLNSIRKNDQIHQNKDQNENNNRQSETYKAQDNENSKKEIIHFDQEQSDSKFPLKNKSTWSDSLNQFKFKLSEYMLSIFYRFGKLRRKKMIFDYSIKQLENCMDLQFVINKLSEIDKLKRIIFNDDQLILFDYLPKPSIFYSFNKQNTLFHDKENFIFPQKQKDQQENIEIASFSFSKIQNQRREEINTRIIQYLDKNYKNIFSQRKDIVEEQLLQVKQPQNNQNEQKSSAETDSKQTQRNKMICSQEYFANNDQEDEIYVNSLKYSNFEPSPRLQNSNAYNIETDKKDILSE